MWPLSLFRLNNLCTDYTPSEYSLSLVRTFFRNDSSLIRRTLILSTVLLLRWLAPLGQLEVWFLLQIPRDEEKIQSSYVQLTDAI